MLDDTHTLLSEDRRPKNNATRTNLSWILLPRTDETGFIQFKNRSYRSASAGIGSCCIWDILSFAADSIEQFLHHVWHAVPYLTYVFTELKLGDEDYHDGYWSDVFMDLLF